jgi:hypothetical protein
MKLDLLTDDLSDKRILLTLSGGINSAALLCYLATVYPVEERPKELYLYYVHLIEHSPDTFKFVKDCIRYAYKHFDCVHWAIRWDSVLRFFEKEGIIPHPIISPCTEHLKIVPIIDYKLRHGIDIDLVGYVREEKNRINRQIKKNVQGKLYPIAHFSDKDCFDLVDSEIGWHPAIYDVKDEKGRRIFQHNNCLPCKNMQGRLDQKGATKDYKSVKLYYPEYFDKAKELSDSKGLYWGRNEKDADFDGYCKFCEY